MQEEAACRGFDTCIPENKVYIMGCFRGTGG